MVILINDNRKEDDFYVITFFALYVIQTLCNFGYSFVIPVNVAIKDLKSFLFVVTNYQSLKY